MILIDVNVFVHAFHDGAPDHARDPLGRSDDVGGVRRVGAHRGDRDELGELLAQGGGRRRHGRAV